MMTPKEAANKMVNLWLGLRNAKEDIKLEIKEIAEYSNEIYYSGYRAGVEAALEALQVHRERMGEPKMPERTEAHTAEFAYNTGVDNSIQIVQALLPQLGADVKAEEGGKV